MTNRKIILGAAAAVAVYFAVRAIQGQQAVASRTGETIIRDDVWLAPAVYTPGLSAPTAYTSPGWPMPTDAGGRSWT